jgi:hypothetical protein
MIKHAKSCFVVVLCSTVSFLPSAVHVHDFGAYQMWTILNDCYLGPWGIDIKKNILISFFSRVYYWELYKRSTDGRCD